jgi:cysteine desulfurase
MKFFKAIDNQPERIYLDWAASTPLKPEVKAAMVPYFDQHYGNPSAIHKEGQVNRAAIETARQQVARAVEVRSEYVTFTAGGTEANNVAILGVIEAYIQAGRAYEDLEIISTRIEHPSVGRALEWLASKGVSIQWCEVDEVGAIKLDSFRALFSPKTVLVTTAYVNSEIGTIQPVRQIKRAMREFEKRSDTQLLLHLDAAQAPLWLSCQFDSLGADLLTLDTAKCGGPKGVGVLIRHRRVRLAPVMFGGGQEAGLRSGTENVAGVVGAGLAIELAQGEWEDNRNTISPLRDFLMTQLANIIEGCFINGPQGDERVANNVNVSIPSLDTEFAAVVLDEAGFAVSTKSACSGAGSGESVVVQEISQDSKRASSTLRMTLGPGVTESELSALVNTLQSHVAKQVLTKHKSI